MPAINPLRLDPTRTTMEVNALVADMGRRFAMLRRAIHELVVVEDAFGFDADAMATARGATFAPTTATVSAVSFDMVTNTRWRFETDDAKLTAYQSWLHEEVKAGLLEVDAKNGNTPWLQPYIKNTYQKGITRAYTDTNKLGPESMPFMEGGKAQFVKTAFNSPVAESKLRTLSTRSFAQLKGITADMDKEMSRVLAQGMAQGKGAKAIAKDLENSVSGLEKKRARVIARTELAYAHNEGQLDSFEMMNMENVGVMAEWSTAHDGLVCPICAPLEGVVISIKEARGLLPRHPNCRCAWIPGSVGEHKGGTTKTKWAGPEQGLEAPGTAPTGKVTGQKYSKGEIDYAFLESIKAEHPKLAAKEARAASRWGGADKSITGKLNPGSKKALAEVDAKKAAKQAATAAKRAAAEAEAAAAKAAHSNKVKVGMVKKKWGLDAGDVDALDGETWAITDAGLDKYTAKHGIKLSPAEKALVFDTPAPPPGNLFLASQMENIDNILKERIAIEEAAAKAVKAAKRAEDKIAKAAAEAAAEATAKAEAAHAAKVAKEAADAAKQAAQIGPNGKVLDFTGADSWKKKDFHDFRVEAQAGIDPKLDKALHDYMMEPEKGVRGYAEVNADLRAGVDLTDDPIAGPLLKYYTEPPGPNTYILADDTMLYRGVGFNNGDALLAKMLTPGSELSDAAFMSTTTHQDFGRVLARRLAKDKDVKVVLNVRVPGGTRVIMTDNDAAQEVLLGPNTRIRIKAVNDFIDDNDDLYKYVDAEIIPAKQAAQEAAEAAKVASIDAKTADAKAAMAKWKAETPPTVDVIDAGDFSGIPGWENAAGAQSHQSYGVVLFDDQGRVLLRRPTDGPDGKPFGGVTWTFAKGGGYKPALTATAEVGEEVGEIAGIHDIIPGTFKGTTGQTNYFVGRTMGYDASLLDKVTETAAVKWVSFDEAVAMINQSESLTARKRDLAVLNAAFDVVKNSDGATFKAIVASGQAKLGGSKTVAEAVAKSHKIKLGAAKAHYTKDKFGGGITVGDWVDDANPQKLNMVGLNKVLSEKGWHSSTLPVETMESLTQADDLVAQKVILDGLKKAPKGTYMPPAMTAKLAAKQAEVDAALTPELAEMKAKLEAAGFDFTGTAPTQIITPDVVPGMVASFDFIDQYHPKLPEIKKALAMGLPGDADTIYDDFLDWGAWENFDELPKDEIVDVINQYKLYVSLKAKPPVGVGIPTVTPGGVPVVPDAKPWYLSAPGDFKKPNAPTAQELDDLMLKGANTDYWNIQSAYAEWSGGTAPDLHPTAELPLIDKFKLENPQFYTGAPDKPIAIIGKNPTTAPDLTTWGPDDLFPDGKVKTGALGKKMKAYGFTPDEENAFLDMVYTKKGTMFLPPDEVNQLIKDFKAVVPAPTVPTFTATTGAARFVVPPERDLKFVQHLDGSTKPYKAVDPTGKFWVVKDVNASGIDPDHLRSEMLTDELYKTLGYAVPRGALRDTPSGPMKVTEFLEGGQTLKAWKIGKSEAEIRAMYKQVQQGFVADALFANHDVAGMTYDNLFVVGGKVYRIDNGGGLRFRAQGGAKQGWGSKVAELKTMRDPKTNAVTADVFSGISDAEIHTQIRHIAENRDALLATIPDADLRATVAARIDDLINQLPAKATMGAPTGVRRAEYGLTPDVAPRAARARSNGVNIALDRDHIEDNNVLVWEEFDVKGNPVTRVQLKTTLAGSQTIENNLAAELAAAKKASGANGSMAPAANVHPSDTYWSTILKGKKTVNYHAPGGVSGDKKYNLATLNDLNIAKGEVEDKLKKATGDTKEMLEYYQKAITQIQNSKKNDMFTPDIGQYVYTPPKVAAAPAPAPPQRALRVRLDRDVNLRTLKFKDGQGRTVNKVNTISTKESYTINTDDDVEVQFIPRTTGTANAEGLALHGTLVVHVEGHGEDSIKRAVQMLGNVGLNTDTPAPGFEEALYLHRGVSQNKRHTEASYRKIWEDKALTDEERVVAQKKWIKANMDIDVDKRPGYDPHGVTKHVDGSGYRHWERWDLSADEIQAEMKDYALVHTTGGLYDSPRGAVSGTLGAILDSGGEFTSSTGRLRKGVALTDDKGMQIGASSGSDIRSGGAAGLFTRIRKDNNDARGFYFRPTALTRQDSVSYNDDLYGAIDELHQRRSSLAEYKKLANAHGNETTFKEGLSIDDIDFIRVTDKAEMNEIIKTFHERNIYTLPDGRAVEDIVCTRSTQPKVRKAEAEAAAKAKAKAKK